MARVRLLSPEVRLRANLMKILRFGLLTFAKKSGIIVNCDIEDIVMSRTIAGVFNFPGLGFGKAGVVYSSFR